MSQFTADIDGRKIAGVVKETSVCRSLKPDVFTVREFIFISCVPNKKKTKKLLHEFYRLNWETWQQA